MRPEWLPEGADITTPNAARVYDYALGGFHNFDVDREFLKAAQREWPGVVALAHANRAYLGRVVRWLVDAGVRQFLDIGSGIPTLGNVHETAQDTAPTAKVVYVDIDPVAVAHGQRILRDNPSAVSVRGDLREPERILSDPEVLALLDFGEPVAVLMVAVLHFIDDEDDPAGIIRRFADATVAGSYLALSHGVPAGDDAAGQARVRQLYQRTPTTFHVRTVEQVTAWLNGWEIVAPGFVPINRWHPEDHHDTASAAVGAVARTGAGSVSCPAVPGGQTAGISRMYDSAGATEAGESDIGFHPSR
ncbi:SAM-dependent methyltransferase [Dactylosporangium sp. McL0621]|uniref:SAM-dependent methyltransferase n=1 Tax=Dactylosporangium sp. McL0621 TaxID=3415678 RepID=UPI003CFB22CB